MADLGRLDREQHQFDGLPTPPGSVRTRAGTTIRSPPKTAGSGRTSRSSRAVRPHNSGVRPAWCRQAATVEPIAPRSDDRNAYAHLSQATALPFIQKRSPAIQSELSQC